VTFFCWVIDSVDIAQGLTMLYEIQPLENKAKAVPSIHPTHWLLFRIFTSIMFQNLTMPNVGTWYVLADKSPSQF
jgi:hypothetical protein